MSFLPVLKYGTGLAIFGLCYWFMNGFVTDLSVMSETGDTYNLLTMIWAALIIIYLLFGGFWLIRQYTKREYYGGM